MLTKQANDSWRACFATRTPPRGAGIKGERVQTHISFLLRSRAIAVSRGSARQASVGVTARQRRSLSSVDSFFKEKDGHAATSPRRFSAPKRETFSQKEQSKRAPRVTGVFLKMASRSCVSGCGRFLTSSDGHDRCPSCLGFKHAEAALVDESCSHCGNMTMAMLRSRYLLARRGGIPLALPRSSSSGRRTTSAQGQGDLRITVRASPSSTPPRASHSSSTSHRLGFPDEYAGSSDRAGPSISFGAPADDGLSITASGDELGSGEDDSAALPPSGRVALPESDPELTAMLSRAAESIGLHYRRPPSPERSRLDDWFLGAQAERRQPPPVPFFPEVHEEVTRSWKAPFSARNRPSASSVLTTLNGGAAQGYVEVPPVERAIAMQLCPQGAAAWRGNPRLPSRACKFSSALTAKAYGAAGQAASALHAMALLQVHQAKALKQLHEGDADPGVMQELRTATDLALRATKVTARALGQTMSTLVVQERHLWLTLADMREADKHRFLDSPISQAGLFGEAVEDFAQQFSAAQKQTEAFRHVLPRRSAAVSTPPPAAAPPSARRRGRPPAASTSAPARPQQQPALRPQRGAGCRRPAQPASAPAKPVKRQGRRRPWDGRPGAFGSCSSGDGDCTTPSPGGGPGGESFVSFLFCSARVSGTQNFNKRAVSFSSGSQEGEDGSVRDLVSTLPSPSLFASGQQGPVRGRDAFSRIPCPTMEPGQYHTTHSDPTSRRTAFRVGPLCSISLPHRGYVSDSPGPACTVPGGLARAPQAVSLAPEDYQTRLRDSVRPASPQVQGHSVHLSVEQGCPCLACRSRGPTGEGRDRAGPSSRDEVRVLQPLLHRTQERRWVTTNPGPARSESGPSQAPVQDVDAETHLSMRPSPRLVCSNRPEGRLLPCLDPPSTQTVSPLCVRGASIPVQGPSLRAIPVASCLHQGRRSRPCTVKGSRHSYPQLPRRLAHSGPVSSTVVRTQGYGAQSPQPVGTSGQPRKEQTLPYAEDLFSRHGVGLGQPHSTSLGGACSVNAEMPGVSSAQEGGSTETFSEAPGHMASSAAITPLGLLHMRPLQRWLHDRVPRWAWRHGTYRVSLTPSCRRTFSPWSDLAFLRAGVPLEQVSRHVVVSTDASATGWGAMCNGHAAAGLWTGPQLQWHINCLELLAVWLALRRFRTLLHEKHILVRSDNTATVAYINHQGGLRSRRMSQLARHLLLWSQKHLRSLRAVHVPGELNRAADELSRQHALPGEWRLHPEVLQLIWRRFGDAQVDLFASPDTSHCQLFFSLSEGTLGTDALACSWPRGLRKYAFPPVSLLAQTLCKVREDEEQVLLVAPYWPNRTWFPELMLLATAPPWQIPLRRDLLSQRGGTLWHPRPDLWNLHVWSLDGTRRF